MRINPWWSTRLGCNYTSEDLTSLWTRCWQWSIGQCSPLLLSPSSIWVMTLIKSYDFYLIHVSLVWTISSLHNMCPFCQIATNCHRSEAPPKNMESTAATISALQVTYTWPHAHWTENLVAISAAWVLPGGTAFYLYGNEVEGGWARIWIESLFMEFVGFC